MVILVIISAIYLVISLVPYREDIFEHINGRWGRITYFTKDTPDSLVEEAVLKYAYGTHRRKMILSEHKGLIPDVKSLFHKKNGLSPTNNYYDAYYLVGLSYLGIKKKDPSLTSLLISKGQKFIDIDNREINYEILLIDQIPIGIYYINLYKLTADSLYFDVTRKIYKKLCSMLDSQGLFSYRNGTHYSDELGMCIPFLSEYHTITKDISVQEIIKKNVNYFREHGTDKNSGLPFHGFTKDSCIKIGSANWGRGIGWYALAMSFCQTDIFNDPAFDLTIQSIPYTQFPWSSSHFDSSTALMIEMYKLSRSFDGKASVSLDFIKEKIRTTGEVDFFSGDTYYFNDYSHKFGRSELGNGLLMMLIGRFGKDDEKE